MTENFNFKHTAEAIEWRRNIVLQRLAQGHSQESISRELHLHPSTISLDVQYLRIKAREETKNFIQNLPMLVKQSATALKLISIETWKLVNSPDATIKDKISALALLKDVEVQKVGLYSNVNIVDQLTGAAEKRQEEQQKQGQLEQEQLEQDQEDNEEERQEE